MKHTVVRSAAVFAATVLAVAGLAACGGNGNDDEAGDGELGAVTEEVVTPQAPDEVAAEDAAESYQIGWALPHLRDPYWVNMSYGIFDEAEKLGIEEDVELLAAGSYANVQDQINQIDDLIQQGVDGIILAAVDFEATVAPVERALAAGIPVVSAGSPTNSEEISWVLIDDEKLGDLQAEFIASELPNGGTVATLDGAPAASWAQARAEALKNGLRDRNPDIEFVAEHTSELDRQEAGNITGDILQTNPNVDFISCVADILCKGVADTLNRTGRDEEIDVSTATWNRDTEEMLRDGVIDFIVGERPVLAGRWALRTLVRQLNGEDVPKIVHVPVEGYTRDNIDGVDLSLETAPEGFSP